MKFLNLPIIYQMDYIPEGKRKPITVNVIEMHDFPVENFETNDLQELFSVKGRKINLQYYYINEDFNQVKRYDVKHNGSSEEGIFLKDDIEKYIKELLNKKNNLLDIKNLLDKIYHTNINSFLDINIPFSLGVPDGIKRHVNNNKDYIINKYKDFVDNFFLVEDSIFLKNSNPVLIQNKKSALGLSFHLFQFNKDVWSLSTFDIKSINYFIDNMESFICEHVKDFLNKNEEIDFLDKDKIIENLLERNSLFSKTIPLEEISIQNEFLLSSIHVRINEKIENLFQSLSTSSAIRMSETELENILDIKKNMNILRNNKDDFNQVDITWNMIKDSIFSQTLKYYDNEDYDCLKTNNVLFKILMIDSEIEGWKHQLNHSMELIYEKEKNPNILTP